MVYVALGIVAVSITVYIYSHGRPTKPPPSHEQNTRHSIQDATKLPQAECKKEADPTKADIQLKNELQDVQANSEIAETKSSPTTPKAQTQIGKPQQQNVPSFTLDGAVEDPKPAGRLRIDRSRQAPVAFSPRSPAPITGQQHQRPISTPSMQPPPRPSPTARRKADTTLPKPSPSSSLMPPPSRPARLPPPSTSTLLPPPSAASTLRKPPSSQAPTSSSLPASSRPSKKVLLSPGHSPLDWAALVAHPPSPTYLRGAHLPLNLIKVPPSMLAYHNGRKDKATGMLKDAWGVWAGRVYNLTRYLDFHPGGRGELLRGAGKGEGEMRRLFNEVHPWVSWEGMLGGCLVGVLVGEGEEKVGEDEGMEEMD